MFELKKYQILSLLFVIALVLALLPKTNSAQSAGVVSQESKMERLWKTSGHADKKAEAFIHWNAEGSIPTTCAKCHSTPGFRDYLGADGTAVDVVDKSAPIGTTVECQVCHTDRETGALRERTYVKFPSGAVVKGLGPESMCMECHQGRASTTTVNDAITKAAPATDDMPSKSLRFQNNHYFTAAATQFGTVAKGGYEYAGKTYDARFSHITGYNACNTCHNPHSLEVNIQSCNTCHTNVRDPKDIRYLGSLVDYDGDGNMTEGIFYEIAHLRDKLYDTIKQYGKVVAGTPVVYDAATYPYFFKDSNGNGLPDSDEITSTNAYAAFTSRLLKAAYNYQVSIKDPNGFAHGGKYIIELLYDSTEDLNSKLNGYVDVSRLNRTDEGHFDGSGEPWRHWDAEGAVPSSCAKCHSAEGLPYLLEKGTIDKAMPISNGLLCTTCHTSPPSIRSAGPVTFPSGAVKDLHDASNLCLNCHQGRASKFDVDKSIASSPGPYGFTNIHYFAAAASFFGSEVQGAYEFPDKSYTGRWNFANHSGRFTTCVECHFGTKSPNRTQTDADDEFHDVEPGKADCVLCHGQDISQPHPGADPEKFEFEGIRPASIPDYDGDGNRAESIQSEIKGLEDVLYAQMQIFAAGIGSPIVYDTDTYPYFFKDKNANGLLDASEATNANRYSFNAPLLRTGYNLHLSKKEPCGYIHNSRYIAQVLVDSIGHLGGDIKPYTWR